MNMLVDELPKHVEIDNIKYKINWGFRTSILFELLMQDKDISDEYKIIQMLNLYYPMIPNNYEEAVNKVLWFYRCGKEAAKINGFDNKSENFIYSFEYDSEYIYSAFLEQYNIDLQDIEELHWWKFKAMFKGIKESTEFVKIMGYRAIKINNNMSNEQKEFYMRMKKIHEIPKSNKEIEKINDIEIALMNNSSLNGLI